MPSATAWTITITVEDRDATCEACHERIDLRGPWAVVHAPRCNQLLTWFHPWCIRPQIDISSLMAGRPC